MLSQAVSYLSWLESAQHEFEALVRKVLGVQAAESVDWRRPRMVCVAADFDGVEHVGLASASDGRTLGPAHLDDAFAGGVQEGGKSGSV
ncbi:hypothetical protein ACFYY2_14230 [Streptomyces sp. NPDC001822]|uniref:hypothetical protein n=1 Tax=Streptomyces sp. NPDC001822 TaxID=3364614 RepID=UPI00368E21A9